MWILLGERRERNGLKDGRKVEMPQKAKNKKPNETED